MDVHEVLVAARNLIDREGWTQNHYGRPGRGFCVYGACGAAEHGSALCGGYGPAEDVMRKVLGAPQLAAWNDTPGRTKAEVLAAFDKAIAATAPEPADPFTHEPQFEVV